MKARLALECMASKSIGWKAAFDTLFFAALLIASGLAQAACGVEFYVSPQGNDVSPGTLDKPFLTLKQAQSAARNVKLENKGNVPDGGVTVWIRGGRYELTETLVLGPEDSGREGRPMVYRAYGDERPVLSGGRIIRDWKKLEKEVSGLPEAAKGKVWIASVPEAKEGKWPFRQLWVNGKRMTRARWPNDQDLKFRVLDAILPPAGAIEGGGQVIRVRDQAAFGQWRQDLERTWRTVEIQTDLKNFPGGVLPSDLGEGNSELFTRNKGRWATMRIPVGKVQGRQLTMTVPLGVLSYYWGGMHLMCSAESEGHVENALSLLDAASEWYLDRKAGLIYYLPVAGEDPNTEEFVAPQIEQLICLRGTTQAAVQFVELRGLRLEHGEWPIPAFGYRPVLGCGYGTQMSPLASSAPVPSGSLRQADEFPEYNLTAALDLVYAENCLLELCRVGRVGASGIGLGEGCRKNRVAGCEVFDAGGHGIHVGLAHGPFCGEDFAWKRLKDEPQGNEIFHCYVHHVAQMDWGAYGIFNSYAERTRIAHNLVEHLPYCGMAVCFSWFAFPTGRDLEVTVEKNHIHHVMLKLFDGGAIYTKDGVARSSVIRGNRLHDIGHGHFECNGIFLDDGSYGFQIADNMISQVGTPLRFNNTSKEKFTWGTNYFGTRQEKVQVIGHGGGVIAWADLLHVEDAPQALVEDAGPEEPYRSLLLAKPQARRLSPEEDSSKAKPRQ